MPLFLISGENSGQHLYVDVRGRQMTDLSILTEPLKGKPVGVFDPETGGLKYVYNRLMIIISISDMS